MEIEMEHRIICGKSEIELKQFEDNTFDSCACDPPYFLNFMSKDWDSVNQNHKEGTFIPCETCSGEGTVIEVGGKVACPDCLGGGVNLIPKHNPIQVFHQEWATELYRVMKPGAYILVFGGTRTYHRMACGVEDAGFECRDMVEWIYGCLSEDTEILVDGKWVHYNKNIYKHHALCYNIEKDELYQGEIQRVFEYEYDDTAYRIKSDFTDQIVSRNHRCIVERGGRKVFAKAETLECKEDIPFLESVPSLQESFPSAYKRTRIKEESMFKKMCGKTNILSEKRENKEDGGAGDDTNTLCSLRKRALDAQLLPKKGKKTNMFQALQWYFKRRGMEEACSQRERGMDGRKQKILSQEDERGKQPCMERWCNLFQNAWKLCWREICAVPTRVYGDGSQRWLCNGASSIGCTGVEKTFEEDRGSASQRPRPNQQFINQSSAIREQSNTQTLRERSGCRTALATITPFHYKGVMWCVEVPSGAFVAWRNGKIFITGNSGFQKSLDISKQLDKAAGKEREVVGKNPNARATCGNINICKKNGSGTITTPSTEEAIQYNGFGSALKPSHEPILLARKPISERNIASNVLKWGTGGLNIDLCRINFNGDVPNPSSSGWKRTNAINANHGFHPNAYVGEDSEWQPKQGRYPANLILSCDCEDNELVEVDDPSHPGQFKNITKPNSIFGIGTSGINKDRVTCEKGNKCLIHTNSDCVCRMLDEQSGKSFSSGGRIEKASGYGSFGGGKDVIIKGQPGYLDTGGASRFFYQAKASQNERWFYCTICKHAYPMKERDRHIHNAPEKTKYQFLEFHPTQKPEDLICYLMRLITPPNGTTIDPFLGSGTALIAAEREGFNCVGIDSKPEYCEMAFRRGKSELIQQKISGVPSTIEKEGF